MSTYIVPQVIVNQEFNLLPEAIVAPLRAFICGPNYKVFTEASLDAKYDPTQATDYSWPGLSAYTNAIVDLDYTRVFIKDALCRYYRSSTNDDSATIEAVASNKLRKNSGAFTGVDEYPFSRDVTPGDVVKVTYGSTVLWSYIVEVEAEQLAASVGNPAAVDNAATASSVGTVSGQTGGFTTAVDENVDVSGYEGCKGGYPSDTYTLTVTEAGDLSGSTGAITVQYASGGGTDVGTIEVVGSDVSDIAIGSHGVTFDFPAAEYAEDDTITLTVGKVYAPPTVTVTTGETYTGARDTTYIITVIRGMDADMDDTGLVRVTTNNGYDRSEYDIEVTSDSFKKAASAGDAVTIPIGNYGIEVYFDVTDDTGYDDLVKGDQWTIAATAVADGDLNTLVIAHDLGAELDADWDGTESYGSSLVPPHVVVSLYMIKDVEVPEVRSDNANTNWEAAAATLTVNANINAYDAAVVDADGVLLAMPIEVSTTFTDYNSLYVTYRALLQTKAIDVSTIEDIGDVASELGEISSDNPLALGVYLALANANGSPVKYMAVSANTAEAYNYVIDKIEERNDIYTVVPLTKDATVRVGFAGHVGNMSAAEKGRWRVCFLNGDAQEAVAKVTVNALDEEAQGQIAAGVLTWTNAQTADSFITAGVQAGDIVRINYNGTVYDEYTVASTGLTAKYLTLADADGVTISTDYKFEIWHTNTKNEVAAAYVAGKSAFTSRRVYYVWPDLVEYGAELVDGYYLCAAIAGLISGVVPQQGLTNLAITGFSGVTRTTNYFSNSQLNTMAAGGVFIVTQDPTSGAIFARHQLSTDPTDLNTKELSVTKNVDSISYYMLESLKPYIGRSNVTPALLNKLATDVTSSINYLKSNGYVPRLGGQLIDATIAELRQHATLKDHVTLVLNLTIPYPLNNIDVSLVI